MFKGNHYVPVLKWKRAEQKALAAVVATIAPGPRPLTPLIEVCDLPRDLDSGEPTRTVDDHCGMAIEALVASWGTSHPFFLDPFEIAAEINNAGLHSASHLYTQASAAGLQFVPVVRLSSTKSEIAEALAHAQHGICLRLDLDQHGGLATGVNAFMKTHNLAVGSVDIILDLGPREPEPVVFQVMATSMLSALPNRAAWRTVTVIGTAFPLNMGIVSAHSSLLVCRAEWVAWKHLYANRIKLERLPAFGDYGIQHPEGLEGFDPRYMHWSAAIRYSLDDQWLLIKGQSSKVKPATVQFPHLATQLMHHPSFIGATHCQGCDEVAQCAGGVKGFGSAEAWRRIGTVHHLSRVIGQICALPWP